MVDIERKLLEEIANATSVDMRGELINQLATFTATIKDGNA